MTRVLTQGIYVSEGSKLVTKLVGPDAVKHGADNGILPDQQAQPPHAGGVGGGDIGGQVVSDSAGVRGGQGLGGMLTDELISAVGERLSCSPWLAVSVFPCLPPVR